MKVDQLKEYIARIVRAEVRSVIHDEVKNCLNEAFESKKRSKQNVIQSETVSYSNLINDDQPIKENARQKPLKKEVQYTKNPLLNAVLNETAENFKGVPQEGDMVGMIGGFGGSESEFINEVSQPVSVKIPESAPVEVKKTAAVFNRDFRALMKAVDKKNMDKKL